MKMHFKNLHELHDAVMSTQTKISKEFFQHPVESMPQRIEAIFRAKGFPTQY